ncbi:hypothetical protein GCM10009635_55800 [Actinocatenispora thailandica]
MNPARCAGRPATSPKALRISASNSANGLVRDHNDTLFIRFLLQQVHHRPGIGVTAPGVTPYNLSRGDSIPAWDEPGRSTSKDRAG